MIVFKGSVCKILYLTFRGYNDLTELAAKLDSPLLHASSFLPFIQYITRYQKIVMSLCMKIESDLLISSVVGLCEMF